MAKKKRADIVATLTALTEEEWLIVFLQAKTTRRLDANPPRDAETLAQIGIGPHNLQRFLLASFNSFFRVPKQRAPLTATDVTIATTYADLKGLLL